MGAAKRRDDEVHDVEVPEDLDESAYDDADIGYEDDDDVAPEADEPVPAPTTRRTLGDRVRAGAASRPATPRPTGTGSTKALIEGLEPRERLFSYVGAALSVVMGVITYLVETNNHHFHPAKGQLSPQTTLILGVLFGALLVGATLWGRRAPIGFVALFAFLGFGLPFGLPFLVLAAWLLFRSYRMQKEATAAARAAKSDRGAQSARTSASRSTAKADGAGTTPRGSRAKAPARPEGNKRYTPKRPPPPTPKPSRRDRKAAEAAE